MATEMIIHRKSLQAELSFVGKQMDSSAHFFLGNQVLILLELVMLMSLFFSSEVE